LDPKVKRTVNVVARVFDDQFFGGIVDVRINDRIFVENYPRMCRNFQGVEVQVIRRVAYDVV
jgi:hypothetical protein